MDMRSIITSQIDSIERIKTDVVSHGELSNVPKEQSNVPKKQSNVSKEQSNVSKEQSNVPKELNSEKTFSKDEVVDIVDKLNAGNSDVNARISFSIHEKTNRIIVKVRDKETNEVIREFPPKEAIKLLEHLKDYLGMLVDESR